MRLVIALGGNALLRRGEPLTAENQRRNMHGAAAALAKACTGNEVAIVHGNGPQVGLLALEAAAYKAVGPYPLDVLGAEAQGMIGYVVAQELRNALRNRPIACLLTQTIVDISDSAFSHPTKPIGPIYASAKKTRHLAGAEWSFVEEAGGLRRVVPSPAPVGIVEIEEIRCLFQAGVVTICCGGGGIPVALREGALSGVEAVVDKDLVAAELAERLQADRLILLTDVDAVYSGWGTPGAKPIGRIKANELGLGSYADGSMGPKVAAACRFVTAKGRTAAIGALSDLGSVMHGKAGTQIAV